MSTLRVLAIDFGGMSVKYYLFEQGIEVDHVVTETKFITARESLILDIKQKFTDFSQKHGQISGLALAFNSPVLNGSQVRWGKITGFWEYFDIKTLLEAADVLDRTKIVILNDAKAAGYAELKVGAAINEQNIVMLTYGTGIGGAAFINGQIVNGPFGLGAELSNPFLGYDGQSLTSLKMWHEFASMQTLEKNYQQLSTQSRSGKEIFELYDQGDEHAKQVVKSLYQAIAVQVFSCCYLYGPSTIIIGGGLSNRPNAADEIIVYVREIEQLKKLAFPCALKLAKTGNKAGALGAYYYFIDQNPKLE